MAARSKASTPGRQRGRPRRLPPRTPARIPSTLADATPPGTLRLERLGVVMQRTSLSKARIYALIRQREFPAPVRLGANSVAWSADEITRWIEVRLAERTTGDVGSNGDAAQVVVRDNA